MLTLAGIPVQAHYPATLTMVFLRFTPNDTETVVTPDAKAVLSDGELGVIMKRPDSHGVVSLATVVETTDAGLTADRRVVVVLTRLPAYGIRRMIPLPREPGVVYLQATLNGRPHKDVFLIVSSTESDHREARVDFTRWIRLSVDCPEEGTVLYEVDRPDRPRLMGQAFEWHD